MTQDERLAQRFTATLMANKVTPTPELVDSLVACVRPTAKTPAAVEAYRAAFGRYPAKHLWDDMAMAVQGNVELWRDVTAAWALRGYNPANLAGMYEWFKAGAVPPAGQKAKQAEPRGFRAVREFMAHGND